MPIATYVFLDLQSSGLPGRAHGEVQITELCMLAVKRQHLLDTEPGQQPRVQYKLRMVFQPDKRLDTKSGSMTGLTKTLLKHEAEFNQDVFDTINCFISCLEKPVCLIGQNAFEFHFQLVKYHFDKINVKLSDDILCTDSVYAFFDILEAENQTSNIVDIFANQRNQVGKKYHLLLRRKFYLKIQSRQSYKLMDIYWRVTHSTLTTHRAENQCIMIMQIAITRAQKFVDWVEQYHCHFSEVPIMIMQQ